MAVTELVKASNGIAWVYLSGTAAEVLQALADARVSAGNVVNVADDNTSATYCRQK